MTEREIYAFALKALETIYFDKSFKLPRVGNLRLSRNIRDAYGNGITNIKLSTDEQIDNLIEDIKTSSNLCDGRDLCIEFISSRAYGGDYADPYFDRALERFPNPFSRGIWFAANTADIDPNKKCKVPVTIARSVDIDEIHKAYANAFLSSGSAYADGEGDYWAVFDKSVHGGADGIFVHHYIARAVGGGENPKNGKKWKKNEIVGMCSLLTDNRVGYILYIAVAPKFGGQSLASELISFLAQKMTAWSVQTLILDTEKGETADGVYQPSALEQMYRHLGFTPVFETLTVKI